MFLNHSVGQFFKLCSLVMKLIVPFRIARREIINRLTVFVFVTLNPKKLPYDRTKLAKPGIEGVFTEILWIRLLCSLIVKRKQKNLAFNGPECPWLARFLSFPSYLQSLHKIAG